MHKNPLEPLDLIHADEALKKRTLQKVMARKQQKHQSQWKAVIPVCILLIFTSVIFIGHQNRQKASNVIDDTGYSYITVDINPSFELILNQQDLITDVKPFNEDAEKLLESIALKGMNYKEGMEEIVASLSDQSYLNETSYLQVSVYSSDDRRMQKLEKTISNYLDTILTTPHDCMHVDEQTRENAQSHHMSSGRYNLIQDILNSTTEYTLDELNAMNMAELRDIYFQLTQEVWRGSDHESCSNGHEQRRNRNGHHN